MAPRSDVAALRSDLFIDLDCSGLRAVLVIVGQAGDLYPAVVSGLCAGTGSLVERDGAKRQDRSRNSDDRLRDRDDLLALRRARFGLAADRRFLPIFAQGTEFYVHFTHFAGEL